MTADLTALLDAMQARADAATGGPWWWDERGDLRPTPHDEWGLDNLIGWDPILEAPVLRAEDAEFIAAARTDMEQLLAAVRAVLDLVEHLKSYGITCECGHSIGDSHNTLGCYAKTQTGILVTRCDCPLDDNRNEDETVATLLETTLTAALKGETS